MASIGSLSVTLGLSSGSFIAGLGRASGSLSAFAGQAKGVLSSISVTGTGLMGGLLAGVGGITGMVKDAVSAAADMEALELSFQGIAGGAAEAKQLVKDIASFAAETPFETMPLAESVKLLATMGFSARESLGIIQQLGDVIATSGKGSAGLNQVALALGQIRLMGRLQGQDAMQLTNAGIPIWDALAKRLGKTTAQVRKMSEAGAIDARTAIMAVLDVAKDPKFAGAQERLSKSLSGVWSTLKDNTTLALADLGKIIAESFDLRGTATAITGFIAHLRQQLEGLRPVLSLIGAAFGAARDTAIAALKGITEALSSWGLSIDGSFERLTGLRGTVLNFFESVAKGAGRALVALRNFGFTILDNVVDPLLQAAQAFAEFAAGLARSKLFNDPVAAGQSEDVAERIGAFRRKLQGFSFENRGMSSDFFDEMIGKFFNGVRNTGFQGPLKEVARWLGHGIGAAAHFGLIGGAKPLALDIPGGVAATTLPKLAGVAPFNSAEAFKIVGGDLAQRGGQGGTNDIPVLLRGIWDVGRNIKRTLDPLIPLIQQNGIGLLLQNG